MPNNPPVAQVMEKPPTKKLYNFRQKTIQNDGGWCKGIVIYIQKLLVEQQVNTAKGAYKSIKSELKDFVSGNSANKVRFVGEIQKKSFLFNGTYAAFSSVKDRPIFVETQVLWNTYFPSGWQGLGAANHASLVFVSNDGITFFEPNWGVQYLEGVSMMVLEKDAIEYVEFIFRQGYLDNGEDRVVHYRKSQNFKPSSWNKINESIEKYE